MTPPQVRLRDVVAQDRDRLRLWRNQPNVAQWMYTDHEIGAVEHARWFAAALRDGTRRYWIIEADGRPVGLVNLYDIERAGQTAGFAYYLAEDAARGARVASRAGLQVLETAFGELGLQRLWAEALAENAASIGYLGSLGFAPVEVLKARTPKAGFSGDVVRLALAAEAWPAAREACRRRLIERGHALG